MQLIMECKIISYENIILIFKYPHLSTSNYLLANQGKYKTVKKPTYELVDI